jgi:glycosyltransferase involved in cell wall biosynthesis
MKPTLLQKRSLKETIASVSVIIPCWKCEDTITRALDSIKQQSLKPAEVIIVNDASGSATSACLNKITHNYNSLLDAWIKVIDLPRQSGPARARNIGWQHASHHFLAFLDADDAWHPRKLEIQYTYMNANPDVAISGHRTVWLKPDAAPPVLPAQLTIKRIRSADQLLANRFHTRSVMVRRNIPLRFETEKRYSEDYLLWSEMLFNGLKGVHIELTLAYSFKPQYGAFGLSGELWEMEKGELDTLMRLYRKNLISFIRLVGLIPFSMMKFAKRKILTRLFYKRG